METLGEILCPQCEQPIESESGACAHCGCPWQEPAGEEARGGESWGLVPEDPTLRRGMDNPWWMLFLLFAALGPFALPQLWAGRAFSRPMKYVLTVGVFAATIAALVLLAMVSVWFVRELSQLFA